MECKECYSKDNTKKYLVGDLECLKNHEQYICGTCGRYICIDKHPKRKLRRWNFPFNTLDLARLYLRTADYITKQNCGIYEIVSKNGRKSYKIFIDDYEMEQYLKKHKNKACNNHRALFRANEYKGFPNTQVRKLTLKEANDYWAINNQSDKLKKNTITKI